MDPQQRIEEAHGLWELAVARLAALVEAKADIHFIQVAVIRERETFNHWEEVSGRAIAESELTGVAK